MQFMWVQTEGPMDGQKDFQDDQPSADQQRYFAFIFEWKERE